MKTMRKTLSMLIAVCTLATSSVVFAEGVTEQNIPVAKTQQTGSRIPAGLVPTTGGGRAIEAEYEYVNPLSRAIGDVEVLKGSMPGYPELNAGAHYYAFSPLTSTYTTPYYGEAYTRVKLPTSLNRGNNKRNAYISLGIFGSVGNMGIDLGLRNAGNGWHPYHFDTILPESNDNRFIIYDSEYTAPSTATDAVIVVTPQSETLVRMYVQFKNASGTDVGNVFYKDIPVAAGNLIMQNGKVACNYYRFASLVNMPNTVDNQNDGTYMRGGNFNGLALYNTSTGTYENWGISTSLVSQAWKVSPERVSLTWTSNSETFNINHMGS